MGSKTISKGAQRKKGQRAADSARAVRTGRLEKFSPAWVVVNAKDAPGYKLELIERIRVGVKKDDWKQLITSIGSTEKEFEYILPTSISSMQKKSVYSQERLLR
jgi:hypothetical protein